METREDQLESLLSDVTITARHVLQQPSLGAARDELRRACDRVATWYRADKARRELVRLRPQAADPRPDPVGELLAEAYDEAPAPQARLPYADD